MKKKALLKHKKVVMFRKVDLVYNTKYFFLYILYIYPYIVPINIKVV